MSKPLQQIIKDPSIAVRSCAAETLTAILNYDRDLAVNLFLKLCETEDALLGTTTVEHFLYYALPTHYQGLASILARMINSDLPAVIKVGARQACLSSLTIEEANHLIRQCLEGTVEHRLSAAEVFGINLRSAYYRDLCENKLIQLFHDLENEVQDQAAKCFSQFEGDELGSYSHLIKAFVNSPAFIANCHRLIYALKKTTAKLPDITCLVCEKFIDSLDLETANISTGRSAYANIASELLIRVYSQTKNSNLQSRCLNVIDRMAELGIYGLDKALQQYER